MNLDELIEYIQQTIRADSAIAAILTNDELAALVDSMDSDPDLMVLEMLQEHDLTRNPHLYGEVTTNENPHDKI